MLLPPDRSLQLRVHELKKRAETQTDGHVSPFNWIFSAATEQCDSVNVVGFFFFFPLKSPVPSPVRPALMKRAPHERSLVWTKRNNGHKFETGHRGNVIGVNVLKRNDLAFFSFEKRKNVPTFIAKRCDGVCVSPVWVSGGSAGPSD